MGFRDRARNAWKAFTNRDPTLPYTDGPGSYSRQDQTPLMTNGDKTLINSIINRMAVDAATIDIQHIRLDQEGRFASVIESDLNDMLNFEANIDQTGRDFKEDVYLTMLESGSAAIVPVVTDINPDMSEGFNIKEARVGTVKEWFPKHVIVNVFNQKTNKREDLAVPKKNTAIVMNPFYSIMNAPNSTLKRLLRRMALLDIIDEQTGSGKLNMVIQLPYAVKSTLRQEQAEQRRKDIETQLAESKYGIAYIDGTEKITQLNRAVENDIMAQVEYLTKMLYSQLGITPEIMNGTANEQVMQNYNTRIIEPLVSALTNEIKRKFLSKTARTQGQSVDYFVNPFKLVTISNLSDIADKLTRNAILSTNEFRQEMGLQPSNDADADALRNKNMPYDQTPQAYEEDPYAEDPYAEDPYAEDPYAEDPNMEGYSEEMPEEDLGDEGVDIMSTPISMLK